MSDYTPITGELRAAMCEWGWDAEQTLAISGSDFDRLCDSIDAIHAQLEKENAALKAELDRVTREQEEHAHTMGESIANELREYALGWDERNRVRCDLTAIADRIDAEHERQLEVLYRDMSDAEYVKLPVDADGEVWHVGDFAVGEVNPRNPKAIERMIWYGPDSGWQIETDTIIYTCPDRPRHHHAQTVEDVLREFAYGLGVPVADSYVAASAAKLRLAGDAE